MPTYQYECTNHACQIYFEDLIPSDERDTKYPRCPGCHTEGSIRRKIAAPALMLNALPDGTRRKGWQDLREASKLNVKMAGLDPKDRAEAKKEINKLGVKFEK